MKSIAMLVALVCGVGVVGGAGGSQPLEQADDSSCDTDSTSDDASCGGGGWVFDPNLSCCIVGGHLEGKWRRGSQIKCCGGCAM